jgi:hypothetical protein
MADVRSVDLVLKLKIDLIPETCWYKSLRKSIRHCEWDKLRKKVYADQAGKCQICGAEGRLNCHEVWLYDQAELVQKLVRFRALCNMCNFVTHFGKAAVLAAEDKLDIEAVIAHFMRVNRVSREVFEAHKTQAFRRWAERSNQKWRTDLGEWALLVETVHESAGSAGGIVPHSILRGDRLAAPHHELSATKTSTMLELEVTDIRYLLGAASIRHRKQFADLVKARFKKEKNGFRCFDGRGARISLLEVHRRSQSDPETQRGVFKLWMFYFTKGANQKEVGSQS